MEQLNETLDLEEFIESCLMLYKTLSVTDKANLLNFKPDGQNQDTKQHSNFTFAPEINIVSKAILENDQLYTIPVEERLLMRGRFREDKIRRL